MMDKIVIDAENAIVGRMGSYVAKELLKGNEVVIVNSEKAIISGSKEDIMGVIINLRLKGGSSQKGPKVSRLPDLLLKRMIRGMLPWNRTRGKTAFHNLKCYVGNKDNLPAKKLKFNLPSRYLTIKQISDQLAQ